MAYTAHHHQDTIHLQRKPRMDTAGLHLPLMAVQRQEEGTADTTEEHRKVRVVMDTEEPVAHMLHPLRTNMDDLLPRHKQAGMEDTGVGMLLRPEIHMVRPHLILTALHRPAILMRLRYLLIHMDETRGMAEQEQEMGLMAGMAVRDKDREVPIPDSRRIRHGVSFRNLGITGFRGGDDGKRRKRRVMATGFGFEHEVYFEHV
jgi:hypothetical protein